MPNKQAHCIKWKPKLPLFYVKRSREASKPSLANFFMCKQNIGPERNFEKRFPNTVFKEDIILIYSYDYVSIIKFCNDRTFNIIIRGLSSQETVSHENVVDSPRRREFSSLLPKEFVRRTNERSRYWSAIGNQIRLIHDSNTVFKNWELQLSFLRRH